jgi:hypothetical protein
MKEEESNKEIKTNEEEARQATPEAPVPSGEPVPTPVEDHLAEPQDPVLRREPATIDTSAHKFELEPPSASHPPAPAPPAYEDLGELPSHYGTRKLFLAARDPYWMFCYWDLNFDQLAEAERRAHDGKVFLQLYLENGERIQQIHIQPWSREWMLHVPTPNTVFYAEIGTYHHDGYFEILARSNRAKTPRDDVSPNTDARFVTIPFTIPFSELKQMVEGLSNDGEGLAETLCRLQEEGHPLPFPFEGRSELTEEEHEKLMEALGAELVRRTWRGSEEIIERFSHRFDLRPTSGEWPPSSHWMAPTSLSSPFGGGRDFFMHVNAELIIYGGTHPNATLRIDGQDVALQEDGSFHFHYNFHDGSYHIPIEATSPDGVETRSAMLSFLRATSDSGDVDATPQDPRRPGPAGKQD